MTLVSSLMSVFTGFLFVACTALCFINFNNEQYVLAVVNAALAVLNWASFVYWVSR